MSGTANRDTLKFSLELLRRVPLTKKVTATELQRQLDAIGIVRTQRAVRMQLDTLRNKAGLCVTESPLSADQVFVDGGGSFLLTATYPESLRLDRWLGSFGDDLEVVDMVVVEGAMGLCHERD